MIEGLKIDVKSAELKKILEERYGYHVEKSKTYSAAAQNLLASVKGIEEDMSVGKVSHANPAQNLENQARTHHESSNYYKFMLEHVVQDDTYRLGQDDLRRLGIATATQY